MASKSHSLIPASYLVPMRDNQVLLLRRFNTGYQDGKYSMIAGHVDPGETFTQTVIREAQEEAGILIDAAHLNVLHVLQRDSHEPVNNQRLDVFFGVREWQGEIRNMEPHKCDDLSWFDLDKLPENTIPYIRHVLEAILRGENYSEFGW